MLNIFKRLVGDSPHQATPPTPPTPPPASPYAMDESDWAIVNERPTVDSPSLAEKLQASKPAASKPQASKPEPSMPAPRAPAAGIGEGRLEASQGKLAMPKASSTRRKAKAKVLPASGVPEALDLTLSQKEALEYFQGCAKAGERGFLWWSGGVRAGKSFGALLLAFLHFRDPARHGKQGMILGYTQGQLVQVFGGYADVLGEAFGVKVRTYRSNVNPRISIADWKVDILIRGADKAGRDKNIQGLTLDFLLADEVPNLNNETLHQAEARVSGHAAFRVYTSNKQSKYHWTQKYYVQRIEKGQIAGKVLDCDLKDNHHVDASYREERAAEFTGDTLARFIDNEHTLDAPPLFTVRLAPESQMRLPGKCQRITTLIGHERGIDLIRGRVGSWRGSQLLALDHATGIENYTDLEPDIIGDPRDTGIILNASQTFLARWLRRRRYKVRMVPDGHYPRFLTVIQAACVAGQVRVLETEDVLVENIELYAVPGEYGLQPFPWCIEAFASVIRYSGLAAMDVEATA